MTIFTFEEVAQGADTEAERIRAKEAIYRGLIAKEAARCGVPFEKMEAKTRAEDKNIEEWRRERGARSRNYEHELDRNIKSLRYIVEVFTPNLPDGMNFE